jgi:hypothetical protein
MTTLERLDGWKAVGVLSEEQHSFLTALVRRERFSVFVELSALLYIGVLSIIGGLTWTFREYINNLGDVAILSILILLTSVSFAYCIVKAAPYSNDEVESPSFAFDYVLYFACLLFSSTLAFIETQFGVFQGWDTHLLLAAIVFGGVAYRFDNRFVLSLAMSTLAGFVGLKLSLFDGLRTEYLRLVAIMYGALLVGGGWALHRAGIKRHFFDVFLQLGANAILLATASGAIDSSYDVLYLLALLLMCGAAIVLGISHRRFAFVAYGTAYGYAGISAQIIGAVRSPTVSLLYFVVTGSIVVITLVVVARKFGRDEQ